VGNPPPPPKKKKKKKKKKAAAARQGNERFVLGTRKKRVSYGMWTSIGTSEARPKKQAAGIRPRSRLPDFQHLTMYLCVRTYCWIC
jgi:hypothetical protein